MFETNQWHWITMEVQRNHAAHSYNNTYMTNMNIMHDIIVNSSTRISSQQILQLPSMRLLPTRMLSTSSSILVDQCALRICGAITIIILTLTSAFSAGRVGLYWVLRWPLGRSSCSHGDCKNIIIAVTQLISPSLLFRF